MLTRKKLASLFTALFLVATGALAQSTGSSSATSATKHTGAGTHTAKSAASSTSFAPMDAWKAAVIAGDANALKAMYTTEPPAQSKTPAGTSADPSADANFWASLAPQGLHDFQPKVMEIAKPQPGVVILVLRVEFNIGPGAGNPVVIGGSQAWIDQNGWKIIQTQRSDPHPAPTRRLPEPTKFNTDLYAPPSAATAEITEALSRAKAEHKRVVLMFGGNWCIDCHVLDAALHAKGNAAILNANYILVHVNIGDGSDENLDIAAKYDTPLGKGVPALAVLDPDGSVVYSQKQGEFESSVRIGPEDVLAFLNKWKPAKA